MLNTESLAVAFGLGSAVSWGAGDFSGGFVTRRGNVFSVIFVSQLISGSLLAGIALVLVQDAPLFGDMVLGSLAGICGCTGLVALYIGLARGRMGIVAPLSAVVTAGLPVIFGICREGFPSPLQMFGFAVAIVSVWLLAYSKSGERVKPLELILPVIAGLGFGLFFILIDSFSSRGFLWPLVAARVTTVSLIAVLMLIRGKSIGPAITHFPMVMLAGILDTSGNIFYALATQVGRLDISAVVASLYPAATVILAWLVLKERLKRNQWLGVAGSMGALVLIAC